MSQAVAITGTGSTTSSGLGAALEALPPAVRARAGRVEAVIQLALAAAGAALAEAGLAVLAGLPRADVGVVLGTGFGCFLTNAAYQRRIAAGGPGAASPRLFAATVSNAAAGEVGIAWRLGGPAVTLAAGGASGLVAIGEAATILQAGAARAMVAGGMDAVEAALTTWLADGGLPDGGDARGAAGVLVLEAAATARARGASVIGTVDGQGSGFVASSPDGLVGAIRRALAGAGVAPGAIALVVSGARAAQSSLEQGALRAVFADAPLPPVSAPKQTLGETFGAAGPLALLAALSEAPSGAPVLVLDCCPSGHVAALVARRGALV